MIIVLLQFETCVCATSSLLLRSSRLKVETKVFIMQSILKNLSLYSHTKSTTIQPSIVWIEESIWCPMCCSKNNKREILVRLIAEVVVKNYVDFEVFFCCSGSLFACAIFQYRRWQTILATHIFNVHTYGPTLKTYHALPAMVAKLRNSTFLRIVEPIVHVEKDGLEHELYVYHLNTLFFKVKKDQKKIFSFVYLCFFTSPVSMLSRTVCVIVCGVHFEFPFSLHQILRNVL